MTNTSLQCVIKFGSTNKLDKLEFQIYNWSHFAYNILLRHNDMRRLPWQWYNFTFFFLTKPSKVRSDTTHKEWDLVETKITKWQNVLKYYPRQIKILVSSTQSSLICGLIFQSSSRYSFLSLTIQLCYILFKGRVMCMSIRQWYFRVLVYRSVKMLKIVTNTIKFHRILIILYANSCLRLNHNLKPEYCPSKQICDVRRWRSHGMCYVILCIFNLYFKDNRES